MKRQIGSRLGLPHVHDVLKQFCERTISVEQACESLGMAKTRLYELRSSYLKAQATGHEDNWRSGVSGGNHAAPLDKRIQSFLRAPRWEHLHPQGSARQTKTARRPLYQPPSMSPIHHSAFESFTTATGFTLAPARAACQNNNNSDLKEVDREKG